MIAKFNLWYNRALEFVELDLRDNVGFLNIIAKFNKDIFLLFKNLPIANNNFIKNMLSKIDSTNNK